MKKIGGILSTLFVLVLLFGFSGPALAADPTISGTVTKASDGTPVVGMWIYAVTISNSNDYDYALTGEDGTFTITADPGSYVVYNQLTDTDNLYYLRSEYSSIVTVAEDDTVNNIDFSLTVLPELNGHIYESDGVTPIHNVTVYATNIISYNYGSGWAYSAYDGSYSAHPYNGNDYTLSPAGTYNIYYRKIGYFGTIIENFVLANEQEYTQDVSLIAFSQVSGTITDANSNPLDGVIVSLADDTYTYSGITDASGQYTIQVGDMYNYNGTAVGNYTLSATKNGYVEGAQNIEIEADESSLTGQNFILTQAGSIAGTVKNSAQTKNLSGTTVTADDGYGQTYNTSTASDGTYSFSSLNPSASYKITASKDGYLTESKYNQTVLAGIETLADFNLTKGKKFSGTVQSKNGTGLKDSTVSLYKRDGHYYSSSPDYTATTVNNGRFSITGIDPGNYRVKIESDNYVVKNIRKVKLSKNKTGQTYELTKAAAIYGRVTNQGTAVKGALIYAYGHKQQAAEGYASTTTDDQGYYQITGLKKGTYRIKLLSTDFVSVTKKKDLKKGQQKTVNFKLALAGEISGYITDADTDLPLSNYCVFVKNQNRSACSDSNGYYIITGLAKGNYNLYLASVYYETAYQNKVKVKTNKTTENINFSLETK